MLICDTHADTICARLKGWNNNVFDVTREFLTATPDSRVQTMAIFIPPDGMTLQPTIVEQELGEFDEESIRTALNKVVSAKHPEMFDFNMKALALGRDYAE